jgi:iron complex outermembrane receptor protein
MAFEHATSCQLRRAARARRAWLRSLALTGAALVCAAAGAQTSASGGDLSFDQLTTMEVSGVSKSVERVLDAPAAVTVVSSEDIRNFGFRTLADVLNAAPGFFTYTDRAYSYVGVRGFAPIEGYNARVLLLIDGFPANDDIYQQAMLGNEGLIDLSLIDRVEIIPGPSSSVYGNNAFLGVINVILKNPSQTASSAQAWVGAGAERGAAASASGGTGDLRYLLHASVSGAQGLDVVYDPQPGLPAGARVAGVDGLDVSRVFAKVIDGNLRLNLGFNERRQHAGYGLYGDVIGDSRSWVRDGLGYADLHYEGNLGQATDYVLRASAAEFRTDSEIVDPYPGGQSLPGFLPMVGDWFDTEATVTQRLAPGNRLVFGAQLRRDLRENLQFESTAPGTGFRVSDADSHGGVYAQSDIDWSPHWATSLGLRDDTSTGQANRFSPRLALLWKPGAEQSAKLMYGSAFREPNFFERYFAQPGLNLADPGLRPERLRTLDLNYEAQLGADSRLSLTAFRYRAMDLIEEQSLAPTGELQFQNASSAQARGADLALDQRLAAGLNARLSAEYAYAYDALGNWMQNAPLWTGRLALDQALPADWHVAAEGLFEGRRLAIDNAVLPAAWTCNVNLLRAPHPGQLDLAVGVYNLLDRDVAQPVTGWQGDRVSQPSRSWRLTVGYTF